MAPGIDFDAGAPSRRYGGPSWSASAAGFGESAARAGDHVRGVLAAWRDPRAKALRRRRRTKRATLFHSAVAGVSGAVTVAIGEEGGLELSEVAAGSTAVLFGVAAASAGLRTWRLHRAPLPHALPAPGSVARDPLHRLTTAQARLGALLAELGTVPFAADAAPRPPAELLADIRAAADQAALSIRCTADSLIAVERAVEAAPEADRPALHAAVEMMRRRLAADVDEFGGLVAAAGQTLAGGQPGRSGLGLAEQIERLSAFNAALREVSAPD